MSEAKLTLRIIELPRGGFVLAEGDDAEGFDPLQAVSSIDEASGVLQKRLREWHTELIAWRKATVEPAKIIRPKRFWQRVLSRVDEAELEDTGT